MKASFAIVAALAVACVAVLLAPANAEKTECWMLADTDLSAFVGGVACAECKTADGGPNCNDCVKTATNRSKQYSEESAGKKCKPDDTPDSTRTCTMTGVLQCGEGTLSVYYNEDCSGVAQIETEKTSYGITVASGDACP